MRKLKSTSIIFFLIFFILITVQQGLCIQDNNSLKGLVTRKYILGPNDIISINVYDSPEFNQEKIKIQPDGNVIIAPFGILPIAGLSIDEVYELLNKKISYYLRNPQITIKLEKTKPFIVYVMGAVTNPGSYELSSDTDKSSSKYNNENPDTYVERKTPLLSNILVAAGGINFDADLEHIQIKNKLNGDSMEVNLLDLLDGDTNQDIYLMAYDTVYVPKLHTPFAVSSVKYKKFAGATFSPRKVLVKVLGYVNRPGLISLDSSKSLNINSAIAAAGGYLLDSAYAPKNVYLSRADASGKLVTTKINPSGNDTVIMPNDIIYVPEKKRPMIGKAFDYLNRIIVPMSNTASSYNNWALMFDPTRCNVIGK